MPINEVYNDYAFWAHIIIGFIALAAVLVALGARKGSTVHRFSGAIFLIGMGIAAGTAIYFATIQPSMPAIFDASLMICAGGSGLLALQPSTLPVKIAEGALTFFAGLAGLLLLVIGSSFMLQGNPNFIPAFIHGVVFSTLAVTDVRAKILRRRESRRYHRHMSRLAWAIAIGVYAPLFTFNDVFQIPGAALYLGAMSLGPLIMILYWRRADEFARSDSLQKAN